MLVLVFRDRRANMMFARLVPRQRLAHERGMRELLKELPHVGHQEMTLKHGGEPAPRGVQEEVERRRRTPASLDNSGVGDTQGNGAAERVVSLSGIDFGC